jgi:hypothetical protein
MADSNPTRFLSSQDGDDWALSVEMFSGWVTQSFQATTLLWNSLGLGEGEGDAGPDVIMTKDVLGTGGRSHQFIMEADAPSPEHHTPGTELMGQQFEFGEGNVTLDDILVSHAEVPLDQKIVSHFDVLERVARARGRALAIEVDKRLIRLGLNAAYTSSLTKNGLTVHQGGNQVEETNGTSVAAEYVTSSVAGADKFIDNVDNLAQLMDEDNVPDDIGARCLFITPYMRRVLQKQTNVFSRDFSTDENDLNKRSLGLLNGFMVFTTNHIPSTNIATGPSAYQGDFSRAGGGNGEPVALALCRTGGGSSGIGLVHAGGVQTAIFDDERRNTTFLKAQILMGAAVLHPWCAGVIHVDDS